MEPAASWGLDAHRLEIYLFGAAEEVSEQVSEGGLSRVIFRINGFEIWKFIGDPTLNRLGESFLGAEWLGVW